MKKFICSICGYVYDEQEGIPKDGIAPGTKWADLPDDWVCPDCGAPKIMFDEDVSEDSNDEENEVVLTTDEETDEIRGLSMAEMGALCSNLSKGCEKQYRIEESGLFRQLSDYFYSKSEPAEGKVFQNLDGYIENDINMLFPNSNLAVAEEGDRGALRALVWSEKVTKILKTILMRYAKSNTELLENTNIHVCEICGFVFIGDEPPERCPVCKVPNMKIAKVQRRS